MFLSLSVLWITVAVAQVKKKQVIQLDISKLLNARPVSVLNNKKIITWTTGVDGHGAADGYLTNSAALFNGDKNAHALPDNALIPANKTHPEIKLHYSNNDAKNNQACSLKSEGDFFFDVPSDKFKEIYLALTSAEGSTRLRVALNYVDGTEVKVFIVPDYYQDIAPNNPDFCYLLHDLAKWGPKNNMTEKYNHNIDLLKIKPDPERVLKSIRISKTRPAYLVFWGATAVKTYQIYKV